MSTDRDTTRIVRSWLRTDEHESADRVLDAVLDQLDTTPQRRATWWPARRIESMNTMLRFGIAAAVLVAAAAIGFGILNNVGDRQTPPAPSQSAAAGALPEALVHPFLGGDRAMPDGSTVQNVQLEFTSDALAIWQEGGVGDPVLSSSATTTDAGDLRVQLTAAGLGCNAGDVGVYTLSFTSSDSMLTIDSESDDCAPRAALMAGTWLRSDCLNPENWCLGPLGSGQFASQYLEPHDDGRRVFGALTYTVPDGWANFDDWPERYRLVHAADYLASSPPERCDDCDQISLWVARRAAPEDCTEQPEESVGPTAAELVDWVVNHPGIVARRARVTNIGRTGHAIIDVRPGTRLGGQLRRGEPLRGGAALRE